MTHALFKQIDLTAKLGQDGSSLQAMNALRVIRETVAKHLAGAEAAEEHPLERAVLALRTIAEYPCPEQDNMPAANMREIALAALDGAGASSEPGNPGGEPVSGPGNAGEQTHPAPGLAREHAELRRIAVALKNPLLSHMCIGASLPLRQRLEVSDDHAQGSDRYRTRRAVWPGCGCRRRRAPAVQDPVHLGGMPVMRGSDIPPPPGYRPTPLATLGQQLVRLGQAMQNPNTKLGELTELVQACGVDLRICDTNKESRS
ncbi:hypothetical protein ACRS9D_09445 [Pseudomonas aeruginosa]|uniref:hypothetical protein n=1 Tax=Pseudomonas aeruginosa TaxID=287 RepID=UPI003EE25336